MRHRAAGIESAAWAALAAVFLLRVAAIIMIGSPGSDSWESRIFYSDTYSYLDTANDLADGTQDEPSFRLPGYPILMLATMDLAGPRWTATIILQQIADLLTALIVAAIASPIIGRTKAIWAGVFYLILPSGVIFSSLVIPDVLTALFTAVSGLLWLRSARQIDPRRGALSGLAAGLALSVGTLLKPVLLYSPVVYCALVFIPPRRGRVSRAVFASITTIAVISTALLVRAGNIAAFGLSGLTTQDAFEPMGRMVQITDYNGNGADLGRFRDFTDSLEASSMVGGRIDYGIRDSLFRAVTREAVRSAPLRVLYFELTRWPKFFINFSGDQSYLGLTPSDRKPIAWVILSTLPQITLGLGLLYTILSREVRRRLGDLFWLGLGWFLYCVPVIGPIASFRYGLLFYWALVPFLFVSVEVFYRRCTRRSGPMPEPGGAAGAHD